MKNDRTAHLDRFFAHPCREKLVRLFPNAKEVTESFSVFHAVNTYLGNTLDRGDPNVCVIVVGDGHSPRTGMLFAVSSAWSVYSVDPVLRTKYRGLHERLMVIDAKIEDTPRWNVPDKRVVIVAVHSHALLNDAIRQVRYCYSLDIVSMPCCVPQYVSHVIDGEEIRVPPDVEYADPSVLSPENTVKVWKGLEYLHEKAAFIKRQPR